MLPMFPLLHLLHELSTHKLGAPRHAAIGLGAQVKPFHQIVRATRKRVLEPAVVPGWADEVAKLFSGRRAATEDRHRENASPFEFFEPGGQIEEDLPLFVVDVELEEVVRQVAIMQRMPRVQPFAKEK